MKIKNFKSTKSLYGVEPFHFENMTYFQAVKEKIKLAEKRINELVYHTEKTKDNYNEINEQINQCLKAKEFNKALLSEYLKNKKER
jgi:ABC-type Fe2+-enterobactin transport system substrate-binding protein